MKTHLRLVILAVILSVPARAQNSSDRLPAPAPGNVSMPLDEYTKLVELAQRPARKSDAPPLPYAIKSAEMNLQVEGEFVSGTVLIEGEIFGRGVRPNQATKVPLITGMTVLDAQEGGRDLPLQQSDGTHFAILTGPAEFSVTLKIGKPLTIEPGRAAFLLPVPAAGSTHATLTVPGDQTQVNLDRGLITRRSSGNGRTVIEATLPPGETTTLFWAARLSSQPTPAETPKEVRFLSSVNTLISVTEADLSIAALAEVSVVQGEPSQFVVQIPDGYELSGATGPTLIQSDVQGKSVILTVSSPAARNHQFLVSLVKDNTATKLEVPLITFQGAQRETGEVLVEAEGAIELVATERAGLRRMDLKETNPYLRSLARAPSHAAFRYTKKPAEIPAVALEWTRFPDSPVLSAVAQQAVVTTLVTSEGRSLTEIRLTLKNQSQPFLKVALPAGASILSSEVAGEKVKPVQGADGNRVPLFRPGFRPSGSYVVSFVFVHAGAPFSKKGGADLILPKLDIPIGLIEWEVFLPQQYKVADLGGDAIAARLFPPAAGDAEASPLLAGRDVGYSAGAFSPGALSPGMIGGVVTDQSGAVIPNASVNIYHLGSRATWQSRTGLDGGWSVSNIPSGTVRISVESRGFQTLNLEINHDASRGSRRNLTLQVGSTNETVTVTAEAATINTESSQTSRRGSQKSSAPQQEPPTSANVNDLQRRVAGVLPIAVTVPRTGSSYRFVRPLVVDEETRLTFSYRSK
jgi:hypothetical protein